MDDQNILFYHVALDVYQGANNRGFVCKRNFKEVNIAPFEACTAYGFFGKRCEARLVIKGDQEWSYRRPPQIRLRGENLYAMPILQLVMLKSFGAALTRFSNTGQVRYVDLRDGESCTRGYRKLGPNEDIGDAVFWKEQDGDAKYVLKGGIRADYENLPDGHNITLLEFAAFYEKRKGLKCTVEDLKQCGGFLAPERNERERLLIGENEQTHRETLLPQNVLLKDGKTIYTKRQDPLVLNLGDIGLDEPYHQKALYSVWHREKDIKTNKIQVHMNDIYKKLFLGDITHGGNHSNNSVDDGGNDDGPDSQPTQSSGPTQPSQELLPEREFELAKAEEEEMSEILRKEEEEKKRIREEVERKRNEREEQLRKREEERKAQQDREDAERKSRIAELQTIHAKTPAKKRTQKASNGGLKRAKKEEDLSEYERIREENIKEREQLMAQLGVTPISSLSTPSKRAPKRVQTAESPLAPKT